MSDLWPADLLDLGDEPIALPREILGAQAEGLAAHTGDRVRAEIHERPWRVDPASAVMLRLVGRSDEIGRAFDLLIIAEDGAKLRLVTVRHASDVDYPCQVIAGEGSPVEASNPNELKAALSAAFRMTWVRGAVVSWAARTERARKRAIAALGAAGVPAAVADAG
jgi:hypothetical protein